MRDDRRAYLNRCSIPDRDQLGPRRFNYCVIANPNIFADVNTAPSMKPNPPRRGARQMAGQHLQNPVFERRQKPFSIFLLSSFGSSLGHTQPMPQFKLAFPEIPSPPPIRAKDKLRDEDQPHS